MSSGDEVIDVMRETAGVLRSVTASACDEARALQTMIDAASAALADRLAEIEHTRAYVAEDASSVTTWARRDLRFDAGRARRLIRAAATMDALPDVGRSARAGRIGADHVDRFGFALAHIDHEAVREVESRMVAVAETHPPSQVKHLFDRLRAIVHPDDLDAAWIAGMAKADINLARLPDGWHVTGFLPIDVGAKFHTLLRSLSVPVVEGDTRTAAQRRVDGLDELLSRVLAEGLPTDGTVRPQLHVLVDAGTLKRALAPHTPSAFEPAQPATLVGFGPIGPSLLAHLTCGASLVPVLVDRIGPRSTVLDVGRAHRLATSRQRHAIWVSQGGRCARDHCTHGIDHVHHVRSWSEGGATDLDNLVGLCHACHRHAHRHDVVARAG